MPFRGRFGVIDEPRSGRGFHGIRKLHMHLTMPLRAGMALLSMLTSLAAGPASAEKIANPVAVFAGLDKITGRIISFDVYIDETVQFGALQVTPRVCFTRPPTEPPQTDAF